ncbi:MAG: carbohydrate kinase family protein [Mongoliibacter sp.]|uniref:carbohydrate kinase family protein n=1 Tax=Mongoliibacter sp. TaxID=2022438 RepID=UPI0012F34C0C|nr:carbohydrate kinase family protein [Mongoliibacter sp.]TVP49433.1 MAG: carbohydrate kinase family protein [Mongoliibacter sp.]
MQKDIDIIVVGELLVDLIGHELRDEIFRTHSFRRFQGGSPANLGANLKRLGKQVHMIASVGKDGMGEYLIHELEKLGLDISGIKERQEFPTSLVLLSRSHDTPDFIAYREADHYIFLEDIENETLERARLFHTTCFALSKQPAQHAIMDGARRAADLGVQLSIDLNYAPSIWPDHIEAMHVIQNYCNLSPFVKVSKDDCERIFQKEIEYEEACKTFLKWGAKIVCLTMGKQGSMLWTDEGKNFSIPALEVKVMGDATGAGDAYWSGFLSAWLKNKDWKTCVQTAAKMAALKLSIDGPLPEKVILE